MLDDYISFKLDNCLRERPNNTEVKRSRIDCLINCTQKTGNSICIFFTKSKKSKENYAKS
jgi:hypothetical protein